MSQFVASVVIPFYISQYQCVLDHRSLIHVDRREYGNMRMTFLLVILSFLDPYACYLTMLLLVTLPASLTLKRKRQKTIYKYVSLRTRR